MKSLVIFFDNAPSFHKEGTIEDMAKNNDILLIHLPLKSDYKHFSEVYIKDSYFDNSRLRVDPKLSKNKITIKIRNFLNIKLKNKTYLEIKILYSFIDINRLNFVRKLFVLCKNHSKNVSASPFYEPLRLNDFFVIPRVLKFLICFSYQKIYFNSKDMYVFSSLNFYIYKLFFDRINVIPYKKKSLDLSSYIKKEIKIKSDQKFKIIFIGQLIDRKNILLLTEAFLNLKFKCELTIVGNGPLYIKIKDKYSNFVNNSHKSIKVLGKVENKKIHNLISENHVLVLPSKFDGFGFVVSEAINVNVYTIVSSQVGAKDLITNGKIGSVFKNNSLTELQNLLNLHYIRVFIKNK